MSKFGDGWSECLAWLNRDEDSQNNTAFFLGNSDNQDQNNSELRKLKNLWIKSENDDGKLQLFLIDKKQAGNNESECSLYMEANENLKDGAITPNDNKDYIYMTAYQAKLILHHKSSGGQDYTVSIKPEDTAGHKVSIKELSVCVNGQEKHIRVLCSDPY